MNDSSSSITLATPKGYTSSTSFSERFSILKRSTKKRNTTADTKAQAEIAKPESNAKAQQLPRRRRSLLDTLTEIAKLDDELDTMGSSPLPTESRRRRSVPNLARGQAVCKTLALITADDSSDDSLFDSDSDDEDFRHINHKGTDTTGRTCMATAADSTRSLLFDNDSRFKCVDDFITLTTDSDKGAGPSRRQGTMHVGHQASASKCRSSIIDNLAALAESTRDLAAGLDDETLSTRK